MDDRKDLGRLSEQAAAAEMALRGYGVTAMNVSIRGGEVDIVARNEEEIVFVEVRSRASGTADDAIESVTPAKRAKVRRTAECILAGMPVDYREVRFFVAAVTWDDGVPHVTIVEDAF